MAITQAGTTLEFAGSDGGNTGTVSTTITVPADAEFVVATWSGYSGTANFFSGGGMTFTKGGVDTAMTPVAGGDANTSFWMAAMFYLPLPDTGSNKTLKWDWSGAGAAGDIYSVCSVTFWKGLDTSSPVRSTGGTQAAGAPFTTGTLTALSGDLIIAWVGAFAATNGSVDSWSNLTLLSQITSSGNAADGALATGSPTGNTTVAASTDTGMDDGGIVAIVVKPAAGAAAKTPYNPWPQMAPLLAQKRKGFIGWNPLYDNRRRVLRPNRSLFLPNRKIILPGRKVA